MVMNSRRMLRRCGTPRRTSVRRCGERETAHDREPTREQIEQPVPADDGEHEDRAFRKGVITAGHRVLRGVRDDHQQQDVRDAHRADVAAQQESEDQEQQPVDQRAAQHELEHRDVDLEQVHDGPVTPRERSAHAVARDQIDDGEQDHRTQERHQQRCRTLMTPELMTGRAHHRAHAAIRPASHPRCPPRCSGRCPGCHRAASRCLRASQRHHRLPATE